MQLSEAGDPGAQNNRFPAPPEYHSDTVRCLYAGKRTSPQIVNGSEVYISSKENYDIVVDLQGHTEEFERLKPFITLVAQSICDLDNTTQKALKESL